MKKYILRRILLIIPVLLGVILLIFTINEFSPGDPAIAILGTDANEEQLQVMREKLGLNKPFMVRYGLYVKGIITKFDLGDSYQTGRPVRDEILKRYPITIILTLCCVTFATVIGIPLGIISATKQYSIFDYIATVLALVGASMPNFWLGLMLILIFSLNLGWFPASGYGAPIYWILPTIALGVRSIATITRTTRSTMLECIRQDYIRTARAKGLSEGKVIYKHALRNALIPVVTIIGLLIGSGMGGALVIEAIFAIPGLGSLLVNAIQNQNYPVIQGCVLFVSIVIGITNLLIDIIYTYIDPRIKTQYASLSKTKHNNNLLQKVLGRGVRVDKTA